MIILEVIPVKRTIKAIAMINALGFKLHPQQAAFLITQLSAVAASLRSVQDMDPNRNSQVQGQKRLKQYLQARRLLFSDATLLACVLLLRAPLRLP